MEPSLPGKESRLRAVDRMHFIFAELMQTALTRRRKTRGQFKEALLLTFAAFQSTSPVKKPISAEITSGIISMKSLPAKALLTAQIHRPQIP